MSYTWDRPLPCDRRGHKSPLRAPSMPGTEGWKAGRQAGRQGPGLPGVDLGSELGVGRYLDTLSPECPAVQCPPEMTGHRIVETRHEEAFLA